MRSWGVTTPNLGLRFSSSLGFELCSSTRSVSLSFSDLLRLRLASAASSIDSRRFEPQFRMYEFSDLRLHGDDVYFSLEDLGFGLADGAQAQAQRKDSHSKSCLKDLLGPLLRGLVINADGNLLDALGAAIKFSISESLAFTENFVYLDFDSASPPEHAWRRRLNSHANLLREFSVTFREAVKMAVPPYELPALTKGYLFPLDYKLARPPVFCTKSSII
ncbi:hypothetical protein Syun_019172 [Stephania yunnanensis]|uniref:Uncharacterized protein n=1 Tax=Stephania yunnanensis TaxID=152371 RepID=A0AAP0NXQ4_9MAGN